MKRAAILTRAMFRALEHHEPAAAAVIHEWLLPHAPTNCPFCGR